jgi:hypothetical protein
MIATADHIQLHKVLNLKKADWESVGVTSLKSATLLPLFNDTEDDKSKSS